MRRHARGEAGERDALVARNEIRRRHRAVEYKKFLIAIDKAVPDELDVHLAVDNLSTHKTPQIKAWLARHPRFHMHAASPFGKTQVGVLSLWHSR